MTKVRIYRVAFVSAPTEVAVSDGTAFEQLIDQLQEIEVPRSETKQPIGPRPVNLAAEDGDGHSLRAALVIIPVLDKD